MRGLYSHVSERMRHWTFRPPCELHSTQLVRWRQLSLTYSVLEATSGVSSIG